jgi:hypothetical protein
MRNTRVDKKNVAELKNGAFYYKVRGYFEEIGIG